MSERRKVKIGIIGCGTISDVYIANIMQHYDNLELAAVADMFEEKSGQTAEKYHIPCACSVQELLQKEDISIVLDLTIPAAHYSVNKQILEAGKNLYCEKPLALKTEEAKELITLAANKKLLAVSAPDTFLGAGVQTVRKLLDEGKIGMPIGFTGNMTCPGHELWHPNPGFYYRTGGGPMFDMGPYYMTTLVYLLGPVRKVSAFVGSGRPIRNILGKMTTTEVPTHYVGNMEFVNGAIGTVTMSFDTWYSGLPLMEIYGTEGSICAPDPNGFGGEVKLFDGNKLKDIVGTVTDPHPAKLITMVTNQQKCMETVPPEFPSDPDPRSNMRGLGVSDMAQALLDGRDSRLRPDISLHVVEILNAFETSAREKKPYMMTTTCGQSEPMGKDWKLWEVK